MMNTKRNSTAHAKLQPQQATPIVWNIFEVLKVIVPRRVWRDANDEPMHCVQRPVSMKLILTKSAYRSVYVFPTSDKSQILVGVSHNSNFTIAADSQKFDVEAEELDELDINQLEAILRNAGRTIFSIDKEMLLQHLSREWTKASQTFDTGPRLKSILARHRERGLHALMRAILNAVVADASEPCIETSRSVGCRSAAVYEWLCVDKKLRVIRANAMRLEPAFLTFSLFHPGRMTAPLLSAAENQQPLRKHVRQYFGINNDQARYVNNVVGTREIAQELFSVIVAYISTLPPEARPKSINGVKGLARAFMHSLRKPMAMLFQPEICAALGDEVVEHHKLAVLRSWQRFALQRRRFPQKETDDIPLDHAPDWLYEEYDADFSTDTDFIVASHEWIREPIKFRVEFDEAQQQLQINQVFSQWMRSMQPAERAEKHMKICHLPVIRLAHYARIWTEAMRNPLKNSNLLHEKLREITEDAAAKAGLAIRPWEAPRIFHNLEINLWVGWRIRLLVSEDDFSHAARDLMNCVEDPTFIRRAQKMESIFLQLSNFHGNARASLLEISLSMSNGSRATAPTSSILKFSATAQSGISNTAVSERSLDIANKIVKWLNEKLGGADRGSAIAVAIEEIRKNLLIHFEARREDYLFELARNADNKALN